MDTFFLSQVCYEHDIFNIAKEHPRRYVLSTGGEVDAGRGVTTPGVALYHEGLDLIAIVSSVQSGAAGCVKGFLTCFLEVPLAGLGCMAAAVQPSCLWNSQKACYKTFSATCRPRL